MYGEPIDTKCDLCGSTSGVFELIVGPYQREVCTGCRLAIMGPVELVYLNATDRIVYREERDALKVKLEAAEDAYEFEAKRSSKALERAVEQVQTRIENNYAATKGEDDEKS